MIRKNDKMAISSFLVVLILLCPFLTAKVFADTGIRVDTLTKTFDASGPNSYAIDADGSLWAWGGSVGGGLGDGTKDRRLIPVKILENVISVSTGPGHTMAILTDGSLWAWGSNSAGNLGDGTTTERLAPVKIMDNVAAVSTWSSTMALKTDGSLWAWGWNHAGNVGDGTQIDKHSPVKIMDGVVSFALGMNHSMAIKADGSLWAWGTNAYGQLADGRAQISLEGSFGPDSPVKVMERVSAVSLGNYTSIIIRQDGSVWALGLNRYGQLGDGTTIDRLNPVKITDNVVSVSQGTNHTLAIKADGSLWAWGHNQWGQLGDGTQTDRHSPVMIMDNVAQASAGLWHSMAVKTDGSLWAWGGNWDGRLGDGTAEWSGYSASPKKIMGNIKLPPPLPGQARVHLDGMPMTFDVPPQIINGRTMVPLRAIFEEMGADVLWDSDTQTVTATKDDTVVIMKIGDTSPTVNGRIEAVDQSGVIINGRTLAPLRFVAEAFGGAVQWDAENRTANIVK